MRCLVLGVVVLWLLACGPSAAQLHTARTATYRTKATELLSIAEAAASEDYTIGDRNPAGLELITQPQWYSPEGGRQSAGAGDFVQLDDRSVQLALIIQVTEVEPLDRDVAASQDVQSNPSGAESRFVLHGVQSDYPVIR